MIVKAGAPPAVRVGGKLSQLTEAGPMEASDVARLLDGVIPRARAAELDSTGETEFAHSATGLGRFRVGAYRQRGSLALVFHRVVPGLPAAEQLNLPPILDKLTSEGRGLVFITGPAGSGVTTTMCALVDHINATRACHVVTVESPIEYLHRDKRALVVQREVGSDTRSVGDAVRIASRHGADVIACGTLPDADARRAALEAAEGGSLVIGVVPSMSAAETLVRLVEAFPEEERRHVRSILATVLRGVLGQRLLERADGKGRVAAFEVLLGTAKVEDCIADDRLSDLPRLVADGEYNGMQTLDRALALLVRDGLVSMREALAAAIEPEEMRLAVATYGGSPF